MKYKLEDLTDSFYYEVSEELKNNYKNLIEKKVRKFNVGIFSNLTSVTKLNPVTKNYEKYEYPLEYHLKVIYNFCAGNLDVKSKCNIKISLDKVLDVCWERTFIKKEEDNIQWQRWEEETKLGFLLSFTRIKLKLYQDEDLKGIELSILSGYTNQHICNLLNQQELKGEKRGKSWIIPNSSARDFLLERKGDYYPNL